MPSCKSGSDRLVDFDAVHFSLCFFVLMFCSEIREKKKQHWQEQNTTWKWFEMLFNNFLK